MLKCPECQSTKLEYRVTVILERFVLGTVEQDNQEIIAVADESIDDAIALDTQMFYCLECSHTWKDSDINVDFMSEEEFESDSTHKKASVEREENEKSIENLYRDLKSG